MNDRNDTTNQDELSLDDRQAAHYSRPTAPKLRVYKVAPVNGTGVRFIRAKGRAAALRHIVDGLTAAPATVDDMAEFADKGFAVENEGQPCVYLTEIRSIPFSAGCIAGSEADTGGEEP